MEKRGRLKDQFVARENNWGNPDQSNLKYPETGRHRDLTEVKVKCGGDIEVAVDVMHVVEAPQKRKFVIGEMPVKERKIQQQKSNHALSRCRKFEPVEQTE